MNRSKLPIVLFLMSVSFASQAAEMPETVFVPSGSFIFGSDRTGKDYGYRLDEAAYGHSVTRNQKWYENEEARQKRELPAFTIMKNLVTNSQYENFVSDTGHAAPGVTEKLWRSYGLIHPFERTIKFQWVEDIPDPARLDHPVVLVSHSSAVAYAKWLSDQTGEIWRLPTAKEWEKAARGPLGNRYPWGNDYDANVLNSHDKGPFDTTPVGSFPDGASPYGMLDASGQVFEWTSTPKPGNHYVVKGGSWDDKGCGVCRSAAWHTRPASIKHILVGFRLVKE
ncbi:formylglycine-generating enzyme family protein [Sneathiella marina]|uniref:Formylglycine-generating enzyme family protein n=1 Tax=Sneathiella marina TaxID=2950108 RepID=A0ABY4W0Z1_9PROT|nr:SUMF1/EgtB/PvdO family nonheme iron enzyme [Sneathiella marina]USG60624.1 formylglycine-generating enzyme family protein [Sneathiella marina]